MKKISIIVPVYNVEQELPRCIESLTNQSFENIEIILVNDGSSDSSLEICYDYAQKDSRIIVINQKNKGLSGARNVGLLKASGLYVLFVDSDDYICRLSCEKFIEIIMKSEPDIIVGVGEKVFKGGVELMRHTNLIPKRVYSSSEYVMKAIVANQWYAPVWLKIYKREFLISNKLLQREGFLHEDMEFLPRVFLLDSRVVYMDYIFYYYIIREDSITQNRKSNKNFEDLIIILSEWKEMFDLISDIKFRRLLYGVLVKQYLFACREHKKTNRNYINGINLGFALTYGLNLKEKVKVLLFFLCPKLYVRL